MGNSGNFGISGLCRFDNFGKGITGLGNSSESLRFSKGRRLGNEGNSTFGRGRTSDIGKIGICGFGSSCLGTLGICSTKRCLALTFVIKNPKFINITAPRIKGIAEIEKRWVAIEFWKLGKGIRARL